MKKLFLLLFLFFISLACYAEGNQLDTELFNILLVLLAILLAFVAFSFGWHYFNKRKRKKGVNRRDALSPKKDRDLIAENLNLREELLFIKEELNKKIEENDCLKSEIIILRNKISSYNDTDSEKSEDKKQELQKKEDSTLKNGIENKKSSSDYCELTVLNGSLVKAESEHTVYYRSWRKKGKLLFEFVNNERTKKAINNRTIIIEPFCINQESSKSPDVSEEVETKLPGLLAEDYTIIKKAEIIYK